MANYDRRFLVPYLQDVCSVEMICAKLSKDIAKCNANIRSSTQKGNQKIVDPPAPNEASYYEGCNDNLGACIPGVIILLIAFWVLNKLGGLWLFKLVGILGVGYGALCCWMGISDAVEQNNRAKERYESALKNHKETLKRNEMLRNQLPEHQNNALQHRNHLDILQKCYRQATQLRENVYNVNIIPRQYRNIHTAYYLYDFFSTCRETDLEKIIQTFVLEEIKQRLDRIIEQNEQILINQRIQIALQEQQNKSAGDYQREQLRRIAKMEKNQELSNDYQQMIAKNQEVTNFILAADYIRKYR